MQRQIWLAKPGRDPSIFPASRSSAENLHIHALALMKCCSENASLFSLAHGGAIQGLVRSNCLGSRLLSCSHYSSALVVDLSHGLNAQ